ncbi:LAME_0D07382g1_1 [Lachancea meyersii CBS 8951]|uniref:LAME_0D07382g1_1 n=1 Tax=Lachancea meyersii CBS 8951 TaxID=1266667 RepID=A0A1G4J9K5_9SACH|nr:LAME_0D07382g1_1 [Lachancea meyersii CBS 8951]
MDIEQPNYDAEPALKSILGSSSSLNDIDELIHATRALKFQLEDEIVAGLPEDKSNDQTLKSSELLSEFQTLLAEVGQITSLSQATERTISQLTKDISQLDNAKRNLSRSMTFFQNLEQLTVFYFQCRNLLESKDFKGMRPSYNVMSGLVTYFQDYKSVEEIGYIVAKVSRLQTETLGEVKKVYHDLLTSRSIAKKDFDESMLRDGACALLETNTGAKAKLIDWAVNKLLYELTEIFQVDDEAGSLENLSRRYVYFKKVLNSFNSELAQTFPKNWDMPIKITTKFYAITGKDLDILLKRELEVKPSIDVFMGALQTTLEFEKYIGVKFANRLNTEDNVERISKSFEPYLVLWIQHQESLMNSKILNYMAEDKRSQSSDSLVLPSSADLFRTYRSLLSQTLELIQSGDGRDQMLFELAAFFNTWLKTYLEKILRPLLVPPNARIENKEEAMTYTLLVLNTADYCSTTIRQLEDKLIEYLSDDKKLNQPFDKVHMQYGAIVSSAMDLLLNSLIAPDLSFAWREFDNTDWKSVQVEDYSRYTVTLREILRDEKSIMRKTIPRFNRELYSWNFMGKVIELICDGFVSCIFKLLKPRPPFANLNVPRTLQVSQVVNIGEQLQLDTECLRQALIQWADDLADMINGSDASSKRIKKHIEQSFEQLTSFLKLLTVPLDVPDIYQENYAAITDNNRNTLSWCFVLALKGLPWELARWKALHRAFQDTNDKNAADFPLLPFFARCKPIALQFQYDLTSINDPTWQKFVREELSLTPTVEGSASSSSGGRSLSPTPRLAPSKLNGNIKNLMSNAGFFHRGG